MKKINVAVVGYGNIGQYAARAVRNAPDMCLAGVLRRNPGERPAELSDITVSDHYDDFGPVDVALLCVPTRSVEEYAACALSRGISTVDSFDIHADILKLRAALSKPAKVHNAAAIVSAGWDPGSDSVVRALLEAAAPKGITYTDFGPGMSMGHSVAARAIPGVADALSMTIPTGTGVHRRVVYVSVENDVDFEAVAKELKADPYFANDETYVVQVPDVNILKDMGHGVRMSRKGVSGSAHNQRFEFNMSINNPALTSQMMVSYARAALLQRPGAYTTVEIPVLDLLPGDRDENIRRLV